jgi:hypothetical protein
VRYFFAWPFGGVGETVAPGLQAEPLCDGCEKTLKANEVLAALHPDHRMRFPQREHSR